jgi:hypothetical protein
MAMTVDQTVDDNNAIWSPSAGATLIMSSFQIR